MCLFFVVLVYAIYSVNSIPSEFMMKNGAVSIALIVAPIVSITAIVITFFIGAFRNLMIGIFGQRDADLRKLRLKRLSAFEQDNDILVSKGKVEEERGAQSVGPEKTNRIMWHVFREDHGCHAVAGHECMEIHSSRMLGLRQNRCQTVGHYRSVNFCRSIKRHIRLWPVRISYRALCRDLSMASAKPLSRNTPFES